MPIKMMFSALTVALTTAAVGAVAGASPMLVLATYLISGYAATCCLATREASRIRAAVATARRSGGPATGKARLRTR